MSCRVPEHFKQLFLLFFFYVKESTTKFMAKDLKIEFRKIKSPIAEQFTLDEPRETSTQKGPDYSVVSIVSKMPSSIYFPLDRKAYIG